MGSFGRLAAPGSMGLSAAGGASKGKQAARSVKSAPGVAARLAAVRVLHAFLDDHQSIDHAIGSDAGLFDTLDQRERGLARAILGMALRRHGQIRAALKQFIEKPLPKKTGTLAAVLDVAAAQILFMDVADHAAVSIAVDTAMADRDARHFKGLVNAVLRRLAEQRDRILAEQDAAALDTPDWLWRSWVKSYGEDAARAVATAHLNEPSLDLTVKSDAAGWAEKLDGIVLPTGSVRLIGHGTIDTLPGFADGAWWVQDAAAALPVRLLGDIGGKAVADLCAAPGGKTLQLAAAGAMVTAVDIAAPRLQRVAENLARLQLRAELVVADVETWRPAQLFDAVLLDAPCSATGTIRRHPDVALTKRPQDIRTLAALQTRMIAQATAMLKPGGTLVYCTCSLQSEEGEDQVERALSQLPLALSPIDDREFPGLDGLCRNGFLRTLPSDWPHCDPRLGGLDGFFAARFRRI